MALKACLERGKENSWMKQMAKNTCQAVSRYFYPYSPVSALSWYHSFYHFTNKSASFCRYVWTGRVSAQLFSTAIAGRENAITEGWVENIPLCFEWNTQNINVSLKSSIRSPESFLVQQHRDYSHFHSWLSSQILLWLFTPLRSCIWWLHLPFFFFVPQISWKPTSTW